MLCFILLLVIQTSFAFQVLFIYLFFFSSYLLHSFLFLLILLPLWMQAVNGNILIHMGCTLFIVTVTWMLLYVVFDFSLWICILLGHSYLVLNTVLFCIAWLLTLFYILLTHPYLVHNSVFQVDWGEASMIQAEHILLKHALMDPSNERFVFLSDRCAVNCPFL